MLDYKPITYEYWRLTSEGEQLAKEGSHEARVFAAIPAGEEGLEIKQLQVWVKTTSHVMWWILITMTRASWVPLPRSVRATPSGKSGLQRRVISCCDALIQLKIKHKRICNKSKALVNSGTPRLSKISRNVSSLRSSKLILGDGIPGVYMNQLCVMIERLLPTRWQRVLNSLSKLRRKLLISHMKCCKGK